MNFLPVEFFNGLDRRFYCEAIAKNLSASDVSPTLIDGNA